MQEKINTNSQKISKKEYAILIVKMLIFITFWAGTFISSRISAVIIDPHLFGFLRFFLAFIFLLGLLKLNGESFFKTKITIQECISFFLLALFGIVLYNIALLESLKYVTASRASIITSTCPIPIAIGAALFLKEPLNKFQLGGIVIGVLGAVTILSNGQLLSIFNETSFGDILLIGATLAWASNVLLSKVAISKQSPLLVLTWTALWATILFFPLSYQKISSIPELPNNIWWHIIFLGIGSFAIACKYYYDAMQKLGATKTGVFICFIPAVAILLSVLFLDEVITLPMYIGCALAIIGVYLTNK